MNFRSQSQTFIEEQTTQERFSLLAVYKHLAQAEQSDEPLQLYASIAKSLGTKVSQAVLQGLLRSVFFIELVKTPKIESTKFAVRWSEALEKNQDPRYASYAECLSLFEQLTQQLDSALKAEENGKLLEAFSTGGLLPYEIPLDYRQRLLTGHLHSADNLAWTWDDAARRVIGLRLFLRDAQLGSLAQVFVAAYKKIAVKTYLTDRVLTGDFKTNREKRWEVHPASVHFALRRDCWNIEATLIRQICHFQGFPAAVATALENAGLIEWGERPFRCPITLEPLRFEEFAAEVTSPTHGRSNFQVGHLNPLKAAPGDEANGHGARNISWISADGNRIQGALSLAQTRALLRRIAENYRATETAADIAEEDSEEDSDSAR